MDDTVDDDVDDMKKSDKWSAEKYTGRIEIDQTMSTAQTMQRLVPV